MAERWHEGAEKPEKAMLTLRPKYSRTGKYSPKHHTTNIIKSLIVTQTTNTVK